MTIKEIRKLINEAIIDSLNEGLMANLDIIRQESKNLNDFIKKAKQEYPNLKNMENVDNWLKSIYDDEINESNEIIPNKKRSIIDENNVLDVHKSTRRVKSVTNPMYPFYPIKDYMDVGYWDQVKESDFRKAYKEAIDFLLRPNSNTARIANQYNWVTSFDDLWQYQQNKED